MNSLSRLVSQTIKKLNLTKSDFVINLGYKNVNKGIRTINHILMNLDDNTRLINIQKTLEINKLDFVHAYLKSIVKLKKTEELLFKPSIIINYKKRISFFSRVSTAIHIPVSFSTLFTLDEELMLVCEIYFEQKFKSESLGFTYYRNYHEKYKFNKHGFILD